MTKNQYLLIGLIVIFFLRCTHPQRIIHNYFENCKDSIGRTFLGKDFAIEELAKLIYNHKTESSNGRIVVTNKELLISIAEPILFELYGKENILNQRPYELNLLDD